MTLDAALAADCAGETELAADLYEEALASRAQSVETLLDIAILYWQATDPGHREFRAGFLERADARCEQILDQARLAFPENTEVEFWQRYIHWADLGEVLTIEDCRKLLQRDPTTLLPAMFIWMQTLGRECVEQVSMLRREYGKCRTARARYVTSVIEDAGGDV